MRDKLAQEYKGMSDLLASVQRSPQDIGVHEFAAIITQRQIDDVDRETYDKHIAANEIGEVIVRRLRLSWSGIHDELDNYKSDWTHPGEVIDLSFLKDVSNTK